MRIQKLPTSLPIDGSVKPHHHSVVYAAIVTPLVGARVLHTLYRKEKIQTQIV